MLEHHCWLWIWLNVRPFGHWCTYASSTMSLHFGPCRQLLHCKRIQSSFAPISCWGWKLNWNSTHLHVVQALPIGKSTIICLTRVRLVSTHYTLRVFSRCLVHYHGTMWCTICTTLSAKYYAILMIPQMLAHPLSEPNVRYTTHGPLFTRLQLHCLQPSSMAYGG